MARLESGVNWGVKSLEIDPCESFAHVAQLAEHVLGKDEVTSSTLVMGSRFWRRRMKKRMRPQVK
jgi:hypothetical protein